VSVLNDEFYDGPSYRIPRAVREKWLSPACTAGARDISAPAKGSVRDEMPLHNRRKVGKSKAPLRLKGGG